MVIYQGGQLITNYPKLLIRFEVVFPRNKQYFTLRGPYNSRHSSRALAIVERMSRRSVSSVNSRVFGIIITDTVEVAEGALGRTL